MVSYEGVVMQKDWFSPLWNEADIEEASCADPFRGEDAQIGNPVSV